MKRVAWVVVLVAACSRPEQQVPGDASPGVDADAGASSTIAFAVTPKRLLANGNVKARLTVTLHDGSGAPLVGRQVTIASDGPATIEPASGTTDAAGAMTATLLSTVIGERQLTATADELSATATITLTDPCSAPRLPGPPGVALGYSVAGDFNEDGVLDLIGTTATGFGFASGNRDASFQPLDQVSNVGSGAALVAADFNGDGHLDVAGNTYGSTTNNAVILLGNGDGTFAAATLIPISSGQGPVVSGDFDGDGKIDVAYTSASSGDPPIDILYGYGDGTFARETITSGAAPNNTVVMIAADVDGDHRTDLLTSGYYSAFVTIHRGNANRTFAAGQNIALGGTSGVGAMTAAYLDQDSTLDLAIARYYPSSTTVLLGTGGGGFGTPTSFTGGTQGASIIALDVDHDTHVDLLSSDGAALYLAKGDGLGAFATPTRTPLAASRLSTGDFDADGKLDLVLGGVLTSVVLANATGFALPDTLIDPVQSIAVADFDQDGHLDLATIPVDADTTTDSLQIRRGAGDGTFTSLASYPIGSIWQSTGTIITADLDNTHGPDLVVVGVLQVTVLLNNGDGSFQSSTLFAMSQGARHRGLAVADFDNDGSLDIAVSTEAWVASSATLEIAYGNGNGTFQTPAQFGLPMGTFWLAPANLDGDAYPDLVSHGQSPIFALRGAMHGAFGAPALVYSGGGLLIGGVVVADLDHDGHADVLASSVDLAVHKGHGDGTFDPPLTLSSWQVGNPQLVADLNGDGSLDIVAGDYGDLNVLLGHAGGSFDEPLHYPSGVIYNYEHVITTDIDENGLGDLVTPAGILLHRACVP